MRSTGEVMGIDKTFAAAYAKAQIAAGQRLPKGGKVFVSMADKYKQDAVPIAQQLVNLGFSVVCTTGGRGQLAWVRACLKCCTCAQHRVCMWCQCGCQPC